MATCLIQGSNHLAIPIGSFEWLIRCMPNPLPPLKYALTTQNSRVQSYQIERDEFNQTNKGDDIQDVINKCYRQVFFHSMGCDREPFLESQLRNQSITVRDFIRGLLLSERFYRGYIQCNNNERLVKQVIGRILGRYSYNEAELRSYSILIATYGFSYFVDTLLNSDEYINRFGYDCVPYQIKRILPGREEGTLPIYQALPRYSDDWKQRLINEMMMMSINDHISYNQNKTKVASFIYDKPKGKAYILWLAGLLTASLLSLWIILAITNTMFTVR